MKKKFWPTIFLFYFFFCASDTKAQNGLEAIIVEKYYISDANDTAGNAVGGAIPIGSTTYRIYVDMLPGYRFHMAYGNKNHELRISTSTKFFNNAHIGNVIPNVIPERNLKRNTVMLDSWLSAGAAGENYYGILKEDDDTTETVVHEKSFLKNENPQAGIPLKYRDGLARGVKVPRPTFFRIDSIASIFNTQTIGSSFYTTDGAWACLGGSVGLDSLGKNRVLIAQLTTNGILSFELNIQIGKINSKPEKYVARNPIDKEIQLPTLIYQSAEEKLISKKTNNKTKKN